MKKIFIALLLIILAISIYHINSNIFSIEDVEIALPEEITIQNNPTNHFVNQYNSSKYFNYLYSDCDFLVEETIKIKLKGKIWLTPNEFKITIHSLFGEEANIGNNEEYFWYWFRRLKDNDLHYAELERFNQTDTRDIFKPNNIKNSFGILKISGENKKSFSFGNTFILIELNKTNINYAIFKNNLLDGVVVTDLNGKYLIKSQIIERFPDNLPKIIIYNWLEKKAKIKMVIHKWSDKPFSKEIFNLPETYPRKKM